MHGEIIKNKKEYYYFFDEKTFELTIYGLTEIDLSESRKMIDESIKRFEILKARSFDNEYQNIKFIVEKVVINYLERIVIKILYYVESYKDVEGFDAMSFAGDELNYFYDVKSAFETKGIGDNGQISIRVKNFDEVNKEYIFDNENTFESISLNFYRQLNRGGSAILTVFTDMQLRFKETQDYHKIYEHYNLIYNFFRFITYRNNICFSSIKLKAKLKNGKYETLGQLKLFNDKDNFYIEKDKVKRDRQIKAVYLEDRIPSLIQLIESERLYMKHYPQSSADMQHITPARFLLVTAAFEWACQEVYGDYKYKENEEFKTVTDLIYNLLEEEKEKLSGNKKKYMKNYQRSFSYNGVSLAEKIQYALKDNDEVLSIFIGHLYKLNNIEENEYSYNKIAERIGSQRNNYAHGQIDREMDYLVVLDFIVLEWLLYAMRLKQFSFDVGIAKKIINELFGRNIHIND